MGTVFEFDAIGTHWNIEIQETLDHETRSSVLKSVLGRINAFDSTYSRFRPDSLITSISRTAGMYQFPVDAVKLFSLYRRLYSATDGCVTPLIGNVLSDAGYDSEYSFIEKPIQSPKAWDDVMTWNSGTCELTVKEPVLLDFGAAGKGYCVDIVADLLLSLGVSSFVVNAGGDICHRGDTSNGERVGLENPLTTTEAIGIATIRNQSICGSASHRRRWGRFHHTINPKTLVSPDELSALWVIAGSTMLADGLTTALQFVEPDVLMSACGKFSWAVLSKENQLAVSTDFPAEFFTS